MTLSNEAVVVSGIGATTPLGGTAESSWNCLLAGDSGISQITDDWAKDFPVRIAGIAAVDPAGMLDRVQARRWDRSQQLAVVAGREAWSDANAAGTVEPERLAVAFASGVGGIHTLLSAYDTLNERGPSRVSPLAITMLIANGPAAAIGLDIDARAGVHTPVSACASGAEAISLGVDLIRLGRADVVLCGGTEAPIHQLTIAGFAAMRALSTRNEEPEAASRPYDKSRDGFVMGEGAGALVLERRSHAIARGATIYAEVAGTGITSDSFHIAAPDPEGRGASRAISAALREADAAASDVVHINAHATSTPVGDIAESVAIHDALGAQAEDVAVSATKAATGHLLGAAGAVEAVFSVLALKNATAPPTRNLDSQDDEIKLDVVRLEGRTIDPAGVALSTSFGFGGHNVALAFRGDRT
ncbi:MAG: 3-oxoacyl-[acyl-carrier-protein] synthase II [Actinomycetes bacterium]|jgi:3-oxoacyl-[acyl-carrier-protein] synthase II